MAVHNMTYSTLTGSTILVQNKYYSTLIGSTIAVQNMSYSTLRGSTIMVSALNISPTTAHSGIVLNVVGSTMISGNVSILGGVTGSEVYTNGWFRVNGGGGLYWQTYARGIYSADSAGASYGNVSVYGTGINSWNGYDINGRYTFMANGDTVGVHDKNNSWVWYNVNTTMYINKRLIVNGTSIEDRLAALEAFMNNTAMRTDRSYYANMWGWDLGIGSQHHIALTDGWAPDSGNAGVGIAFRRT
jgi:hypothetical protein